MKRIYALTLLSCIVVVLAACGSTKPVMPAQNIAKSTPSEPIKATAPIVVQKVESPVLPAYLDPKSAIFQQKSVYFDFDVYLIKPTFRQMLEMHGKYLAANPNVHIRVAGNSDERGGAEYNLALGQKRADSVVHALKILGVKDSQMEAISFGRDKPKALGHDETSWAENRRVDLIYPSK